MQEVSLKQLRDTALRLHKDGIGWHFHILTPGCFLNESDQYAFVLEASAKKQVWVHYSDKAEKDLGKELLPLLHGKKVLEDNTSHNEHTPSKTVQQMVDRATNLNKSEAPWHHHVLFPDCRFNEHPGLWTLMLEDEQADEVLESQTDNEPRKDLKLIELLFYARKT